MKKVYIKPEVEIVECELESLLAGSIQTDLPGMGGFGGEEDGEADANRHRGEWGNLWAN